MQDKLNQYTTEEILVELEERGKTENVLENFSLEELFKELVSREVRGNLSSPAGKFILKGGNVYSKL